MNRFQIIRIILLLLLIFLAGLVTGRLTAPSPQVVYVSTPSGNSLSDMAMARLKSQITLTPQEEQNVRKLFENMEQQTARYPRLSQERMDIFHKFIPEIKAQLPPEKQEALDRYIRDVERRFERTRRQRGVR